MAFDQGTQYADGFNTHAAFGSNPVMRRDALGLEWDPFDMVDDYLAEDAGSKAAFMSSVISGFNSTAYVLWQVAQLHPAIGAVASIYNLASGQGDIMDVLSLLPAGAIAKFGGGALKKAMGVIGRAVTSFAKTAWKYIKQYGGRVLRTMLQSSPGGMAFELAERAIKCVFCLSAATAVWASTGPLAIAAISPGDMVLTAPDRVASTESLSDAAQPYLDTPFREVVFRIRRASAVTTEIHQLLPTSEVEGMGLESMAGTGARLHLPGTAASISESLAEVLSVGPERWITPPTRLANGEVAAPVTAWIVTTRQTLLRVELDWFAEPLLVTRLVPPPPRPPPTARRGRGSGPWSRCRGGRAAC